MITNIELHSVDELREYLRTVGERTIVRIIVESQNTEGTYDSKEECEPAGSRTDVTE